MIRTLAIGLALALCGCGLAARAVWTVSAPFADQSPPKRILERNPENPDHH